MQAPQDLAAAIGEEIGDMSGYAGMAAGTADPLLQAVLMNIAGDEYGHARTFSTWQELMGAMSTPSARRASDPDAATGGPPIEP